MSDLWGRVNRVERRAKARATKISALDAENERLRAAIGEAIESLVDHAPWIAQAVLREALRKRGIAETVGGKKRTEVGKSGNGV